MSEINKALMKTALASLALVVAMTLGRPASAEIVKYDPGDTVYYTYCYSHPVAARIKPGDSVVTRTRDASNDVFSSIRQNILRQDRLCQGEPANGAVLYRGRGAG